MQKIVSVIVILWSLCLGSPLAGYGDAGVPGTGSPQDTPDITLVRITIEDAPGLEEELAGLARDLIALEKGQPLTDVSLMQAIDALKTSRRFASVDVQSTQDAGGIALIFTLKPYRLINNIRVFGEFPLFEKDVLTVMTLYIGGVFTPEALPVQEGRIKDLYRSEGFIDPKVRFEAYPDKSEHAVDLKVYIDRGEFYHIGGIKIVGNQAFSAIRLKPKMSVWRSSLLPGSSGRLLDKELKKDVKTLLSYFRNRGYAECRIEYAVERHPAEKKADIVFTIFEGPQYSVSFSGNEEFWDYTLRKDLVIFQQGNIGDRGLRKSIKNIVQRYIDAGYADASIDIQDESAQTDGKMQRNLHLTIHEGIRSKVGTLAFEGNHAFGSNELHEQIYLVEGKVFTYQMLEDDLFTLRTFYLTNGFGDVVVDHQETWSQERDNVSVVFKISEGVRAIITSIRITGMVSVSEEEAYRALKLKEGTPLRKYMFRSDENALAALISEKGHPHGRKLL